MPGPRRVQCIRDHFLFCLASSYNGTHSHSRNLRVSLSGIRMIPCSSSLEDRHQWGTRSRIPDPRDESNARTNMQAPSVWRQDWGAYPVRVAARFPGDAGESVAGGDSSGEGLALSGRFGPNFCSGFAIEALDATSAATAARSSTSSRCAALSCPTRLVAGTSASRARNRRSAA